MEASKLLLSLRDSVGILSRFLGIRQEQAARLMFYRILKEVAKKAGFNLPFVINEYERKLGFKLPEFLYDVVELISRDPEILDLIYSQMIPKNYKRKHGQFATPLHIADFMVKWGIKGVESVFDPAVGAGVFLSKAYDELKDIKLIGIDVDELLLNACYLRLKLKGVREDNLKLTSIDFLKLTPREKYDFIVCNPPYIKFHGYKREIVEEIAKKYGIKLSKLTNIYALFFFHATAFLKEYGKMAFITPSEFFYTGYGKELKQFLKENYTINAFILVGLENEVFEDVMTTAVITLLTKSAPEQDHKVKFIKIKKWPGSDVMLDLVEGSNDNVMVREVLQKDLDPSVKWLKYFGYNEYEEYLEQLVPLKQLATVDRGIATGYNEFFVLDRNTVQEYNIPRRYLKPVIAKASQCLYYDFTKDDWKELEKRGERVYLLYCFESPPPKELKRYIEHGLKLGVHERYLTKHRKPWYSVERREPAPILALVFSRERLRFVYNRAGVLNLTPFHCVYPLLQDEKTVKALLAYLNSNICREIATRWGRIYGGGLRKLEPKDLENLPVLNVTKLEPKIINELSRLFDELCFAARHGENFENAVKTKIDKLIERILKKFQGESDKSN